MRRCTAWWLALGLICVGGSAAARSFHDVELPDQITVAGRSLVLNGMGVREQSMFKVDVYVAGLYLPEKTRDGAAVVARDQVRQLVLVFKRGVSQARARRALRDGLNKSAGERLSQIEAAADAFEAWLPGFGKGQRLTLTYVPGSGLVIEGPAKPPLRVAGRQFADVMFGIWVGPRCADRALRAGLLGAH